MLACLGLAGRDGPTHDRASTLADIQGIWSAASRPPAREYHSFAYHLRRRTLWAEPPQVFPFVQDQLQYLVSDGEDWSEVPSASAMASLMGGEYDGI